MTRSALAAAALASLSLGCNDYVFAPVGHCLVQPGSVLARLPNTSSTDILFVVDDSASMDPKQAGLAASFRDFITRMVETNVARTSRGLQPVDFRIAVTTSSIFEAGPAATTCVSDGGALQCCQVSQCSDVDSCSRGTSGGCGGGQACVVTPSFDSRGVLVGSRYRCCTPSSCTPSSGCALGDHCPGLRTSYPNPFPSSSFCTPGLAVAGAPYPAGALVGAPGNPRVLEFGKELGWASWGTATPDPALLQLVEQFQENIRVGSCGSGEEQHLEAARLAIDKGIHGQQPGVSGWPREGVKLVVVWVGDEDDCSNPSSAPLVMPTFSPGADMCVLDKHRPAADQRELPVSDYAAFFTNLVGPYGVADLGAAFIVSSARCTDGSYEPADACLDSPWCPVTPPATCGAAPVCSGAYAAGERFLELAGAIRARGFPVVEGTVCDAYPPSTFGPVLSAIAGLVPPPAKLTLPTMPASRAVTALVILDNRGLARRVCDQGTDWCFVDCADARAAPACLATGVSQCIAIDHSTGHCEADFGEAYQAEYLGVIPDGGCATEADCLGALGGRPGDWECVLDTGEARGTCACRGE
jgi:hypothetical protein